MSSSSNDPLSLAGLVENYRIRDQGDEIVMDAISRLQMLSNTSPVTLRLAFNQYVADAPYYEQENRLLDLRRAVTVLFDTVTNPSDFHMPEAEHTEPTRRAEESDIRYALRREQWRIATGQAKIVQLEDTEEMREFIEKARHLAENAPG